MNEMTSLRLVTLGGLWLFAFGCERDQPLGDLENGAGHAQGDGGTAESGAAGGGADQGGAVNGGTSGRATGGNERGGAATGAVANGGSEEGGSSSGGTTRGGASSGGTGGDRNCFSPDANSELALELSASGCACNGDEPDQCIAIGEEAWPPLVGMGCRDGHWTTVEDGPCEPTVAIPWGCMIENRVFKEGSLVPDEFLCRFCAWCGMSYEPCQTLVCMPPACTAGTVQSSRCRSCGMGPGGCDIVEHGCFSQCESDEECTFGGCSQDICGLICF
jgi:hypothetical protein